MTKLNSFTLFFDGIILFLFIYAPTLKFFPLPLSKLVICYLFAYVFFKGNLLKIFKDFSKRRFFRYAVLICLFIGVYFFNSTTIQGRYNYSFVQMLFWLLVEGVFSTFLLFYYFKSRYDYNVILKLTLNVVFVQALFISFSFISVPFREILDNLLVISDERNISSYRMKGFSNGGGAGLSYLQCIGVFVGCFLLIIDKVKPIMILFKLLVITLSLFFVARTGLMFSILLIFATLFQFAYNKGSIFLFIKYIVLMFFGVGLLYTILIPLLSLESQRVLQEKVFERVFELYYSYEATGELETRSTNALSNMYILPNSNSGIFFGDGLWDSSGDRADANFVKRQVNSDVGVVRLIFAIGIPLTILFYSIYFVFFLDIKNVYYFKMIGILIFCLLLIFFIGETKEPFLVRMSGIIKLLVLMYSLIIAFGERKINVAS